MNRSYLFLYLFLFALCQSCRTTENAFSPDRKYSPEQLRGDYTLFRNILEDMHPSLYWYCTRDSMNYYFARGYARLNDSMTEPQFRSVLSFVISRIDCGHTSVRFSKDYSKYLDTAHRPSFPLIMKCWNDTMVVSINLNRSDTILKRGTIVESINGHSVPEMIDTFFNYFVTDGYSQTGKYQYLSNGLNFANWYPAIYGDTSAFVVKYLDADSQEKQTIVPLYDPRADTNRRLFRNRLIPRHESKRSRKAIDAFLTRNLQIDTGSHAGFMTLTTFEHGNHLRKFFRQSFRTLSEKQIPNLVIDLRSNGGGDASFSTLLTRYIIDRKFKLADSLYALHKHSRYDKYIDKSFLYRLLMDVVTSKRSDGKYHFGYFERHYYSPRSKYHYDGQVYLLTGGNSFSATTLFAGTVKGQKNVTIVGEETGGGFYGNTAWMIPDVTLPNTGIRFRLPRFRLVVDRTREKNGRGVLPDVPALPTVEAIGKGLDFKAMKVKELIQLRAAMHTASGSSGLGPSGPGAAGPGAAGAPAVGAGSQAQQRK
ncbi:MAG: S41 family peptidase [Bacteroidota bacterium]|nr:S41 family peptidase [Bacteroidota bacterium]MDP4254272.1 S41 family peptidase [Bacteroidota bacterium]